MALVRSPFFVTFTGRNGTQGPVTLTGTLRQPLQVGDEVGGLMITSPAPPTSLNEQGSFEQVVSVAGQLQQMSTANLSINTYCALVIPWGWKGTQN